jgi:hypothetical protein
MIFYWNTYINVLLNWEELTMKLSSSFVFKLIVAWRTTVSKSEWFINMLTCRSYEPQDTDSGRDIAVINMQG